MSTNNTTIYLAGPMTGHDNHNYPAFHEAARRLREAGYTVVSPAEMHPEAIHISEAEAEARHSSYLELGIKALKTCDGIAMMPGWQKSRGARRELMAAVADGKSVIGADTMTVLSVFEIITDFVTEAASNSNAASSSDSVSMPRDDLQELWEIGTEYLAQNEYKRPYPRYQAELEMLDKAVAQARLALDAPGQPATTDWIDRLAQKISFESAWSEEYLKEVILSALPDPQKTMSDNPARPRLEATEPDRESTAPEVAERAAERIAVKVKCLYEIYKSGQPPLDSILELISRNVPSVIREELAKDAASDRVQRAVALVKKLIHEGDDFHPDKEYGALYGEARTRWDIGQLAREAWYGSRSAAQWKHVPQSGPAPDWVEVAAVKCMEHVDFSSTHIESSIERAEVIGYFKTAILSAYLRVLGSNQMSDNPQPDSAEKAAERICLELYDKGYTSNMAAIIREELAKDAAPDSEQLRNLLARIKRNKIDMHDRDCPRYWANACDATAGKACDCGWEEVETDGETSA